jgi:hypothetical protein
LAEEEKESGRSKQESDLPGYMMEIYEEQETHEIRDGSSLMFVGRDAHALAVDREGCIGDSPMVNGDE